MLITKINRLAGVMSSEEDWLRFNKGEVISDALL